jgi:endonuclease/exonuclease/phosphatase family metal-dependent hydrolase
MNAAYPHGHHGNAILSRHRIVAHTNHDISDHVLEKRGLLHAVTRFGRGAGREVHLICVHFGLIKRSRLRQATFLADFVQREVPARAPLIIAGDFNDWQQRSTGAARPARRRGSGRGIDLGNPRPRRPRLAAYPGAPPAIRRPEWRAPSRVLPRG